MSLSTKSRKFTEKELDKFFQCFDLSNKIDTYFYASFRILYLTGLRISECMNIKKCDCCHSQFRVWSPKVKRYRDVYFCEECRTLAKLLISQDNSSDKLLYKKNDSTYRYAVKRFCKRAGIDTDNISVHSFRKTIADKVDRLKGTSAAQSLLDHKSIVTTQIYLNTGTDKYRNVIDIISNS